MKYVFADLRPWNYLGVRVIGGLYSNGYGNPAGDISGVTSFYGYLVI